MQHVYFVQEIYKEPSKELCSYKTKALKTSAHKKKGVPIFMSLLLTACKAADEGDEDEEVDAFKIIISQFS